MLQPEESSVGDLIKSAVTKQLGERLVVTDNRQVIASHREVPGLFKPPCDRKSFAFDGSIPFFSVLEKSGSCKSDFPTIRAAVGETRGASAMLLKNEVAHTSVGPVRAEAGLLLWLKYFHSVFYDFDNGCFGIGNCLIQLRSPMELC